MKIRYLLVALCLSTLSSCTPPCEEFDFLGFTFLGSPRVSHPEGPEEDQVVIQKPIVPTNDQDTITINTFNFSTLVLPFGDPENRDFIIHMNAFKVGNDAGSPELIEEVATIKGIEIYDVNCDKIHEIHGNTWNCRIGEELLQEGLYGFRAKSSIPILIQGEERLEPYFEGDGIFKVTYCYDPNLHDQYILPSETDRLLGVQNGGGDAVVCP